MYRGKEARAADQGATETYSFRYERTGDPKNRGRSLFTASGSSHGVAAAESPPILMADDQSWPWFLWQFSAIVMGTAEGNMEVPGFSVWCHDILMPGATRTAHCGKTPDRTLRQDAGQDIARRSAALQGGTSLNW